MLIHDFSCSFRDYEDGDATGDPSTSVIISDVTFTDVTGTVSSSARNTYYVLCGSDSSCTDITFDGVSITGGDASCSPSDICDGLD